MTEPNLAEGTNIRFKADNETLETFLCVGW